MAVMLQEAPCKLKAVVHAYVIVFFFALAGEVIWKEINVSWVIVQVDGMIWKI